MTRRLPLEVALAVVLLVVADHLADDRRVPEPVAVNSSAGTALTREVIASQHFNAELDEACVFARYVRRWWQMPAELASELGSLDLPALYEHATGVPLADAEAVALGCGSPR